MMSRQKQLRSALLGRHGKFKTANVRGKWMKASEVVLSFSVLVAFSSLHPVTASTTANEEQPATHTAIGSAASDRASPNVNSAASGSKDSAPPANSSEANGGQQKTIQPLETMNTATANNAEPEVKEPVPSDQNEKHDLTATGPNTNQSPSIATAPVTIAQKSSWTPEENFLNAKDSNGQAVPIDAIQVIGTVHPAIVGTYFVQYAFTDAPTGKDVAQFSSVTVTNPVSEIDERQIGGDVLPPTPPETAAAIKTKDTLLAKKSSWTPDINFVSATNSDGASVQLEDISITGTVNPAYEGTYFIRFSFMDPKLKQLIANMARVTVVSSLTSKPNPDASGMLKVKNLSSFFPSTSNYPSVKNEYLLDDPNFKPDEAEIVSYFHQYVNELRALNGQSALTISDRDTSRAQQRVRAIVEDFNHEAVSHATENIGTNTGITDHMRSNQEIAYYMVMAWYDETDNPEPLGNGHYGHRANLIYGGPSMGVSFYRPPVGSAEFSDYYAFEAPIYTDLGLYLKAKAMANSLTNPTSIPLPNISFVYVNASLLAELRSYLNASPLGQLDATAKSNAKPSLSIA
ncbi:cell surface protein [Lacticaseibacillus rhamnosus]|uniref:surface-docked cell-binding protein SpcA n=1 Tax=Lacticaseibacillus rhamnosus TaxID=47715 RepID=UPI0005E7569E|nr:surface-docked cell-binding protein SpcA [Lacticaseibacillus rhamnosus]CDN23821.1 cell surface protein [Lacticaseibacillus rhamnosus]